jgi:hypothetical protein
MGTAPTGTTDENALRAPLPGARTALILLIAINLFNYIDRQVLASVVTPIRDEFFRDGKPVKDPCSWSTG